MSKQIKIFMVVGAILIAAVAGYWLMWPEAEVAQQRGVQLDNVEAGDPAEE